jgi:hypothetical protein
MNSNLILLVISVIILLKAPSGTGLWVDLFLYLSLIWFEYCHSKVRFENIVLACTYLILSLLYFLLDLPNVLPFTGIVVYSVFALSYVRHFLLKTHPFDEDRPKDRRWRRYSALYFGICVLSIYLSFTLRPSSAYIYLPLLVFGVGILFKKNLETRHFIYEKFAYKIENVTEKTTVEFHRVLTEVYRQVYMDIPIPKPQFESFNEELKAEMNTSFDHLFLVRSIKNNEVVGCFKIVLDSRKGLPIEHELGTDLKDARLKLGTIAEIGRLSIRSAFRNDPHLIDAIFRAIAFWCMEERVVYLFCQAIEKAAPLYRKMGFEPYQGVTSSYWDKEFGIPCFAYVISIKKAIGTALQKRRATAGEKTFDLFKEYMSELKLEEN